MEVAVNVVRRRVALTSPSRTRTKDKIVEKKRYLMTSNRYLVRAITTLNEEMIKLQCKRKAKKIKVEVTGDMH